MRLEAAFSELIQTSSEFRPLSLNCRAKAFPSLSMICDAMNLLRDLSSEEDKERKVSIKTFFGQHPGRLEESLSKPLIFFVVVEGSKRDGVALAWIPASCPEQKPSGANVECRRDLLGRGEVWLGPATLVVGNR